MALILEVVRPDGVRSWHRLRALPLTVGRALSNDVILDDPYVDARHARIALVDPDETVVEDLGSVNGLVAGGERLARSVVRAGAELRVGRTTLRFRDEDEEVAPALPDVGGALDAPRVTERAAPATPPPATPPPAATPPVATLGRLLAVVAAAGAFALYTWFGNATRSSASDVLGAALGYMGIAVIWAGLWAIAGRVVVHRFQFAGHLAVVSVVAVAGLALTIVSEWLAFLFPDAAVPSLVTSALGLSLLGALIAGHLALASTMPRRRRWRTGLGVAAVFLGIGLASQLAKADAFSDVPRFSGVLKPVPAAWVPTETLAEFAAAARDLRKDVDELAGAGTR